MILGSYLSLYNWGKYKTLFFFPLFLEDHFWIGQINHWSAIPNPWKEVEIIPTYPFYSFQNFKIALLTC